MRLELGERPIVDDINTPTMMSITTSRSRSGRQRNVPDTTVSRKRKRSEDQPSDLRTQRLRFLTCNGESISNDGGDGFIVRNNPVNY